MPQHDPVPPKAADNRQRTAAWRRYKALMSWMALASVAAAALALAYLWLSGSDLTIHMAVATVAGVGLSVLLGTALMGLVYFSSNSGHDDNAAGKGNKDDR